MRTITWSGHRWITQERWGSVHPDKWTQWYDPTAVKFDSAGGLHLLTQHNPKHFSSLNITSPVGVGLVSCQTQFGYGSFRILARLPKGKWLWPAFWMWSWESWPPEIDALEAYSGKSGNYCDFSWANLRKRYNLNGVVHWNNSEGKHVGQDFRYPASFWFNPTKNVYEYRLDWYPEKIEFWCNGKLIKTISDAEAMSKLQGHKMNVIINNGIMWDMDLNKPTYSDFYIKEFSWKPFKS